MVDAQKILEDLKAGNLRFIHESSIHSSSSSLNKLKTFAQVGQFPKAIVLCCSDSRAPVEMVFDQDIGDLFVIRVAGNIVAPSLVGSVEFAASRFNTKLIVVMGHTGCGAVDATVSYIENPENLDSDNIHDIVSRIEPHILQIAKLDINHELKVDKAVEANVIASVAQLSHSSKLIEDLVLSSQITIIGAVLDLHTGIVRFI